MKMDKLVRVERPVAARQIPSGEKLELPQGSYVRIMQTLGGTFTVLTDMGMLARIEGADADALGEKAQVSAALQLPENATLEDKVWAELRSCYDPEIPVNIVELGLVYECRLEPVEAGHEAHIRFTLTAPGCGMGDVLKSDIETKLMNLPGIKGTKVEVVFDPPWDRNMMSEAAKLQLGMF